MTTKTDLDIDVKVEDAISFAAQDPGETTAEFTARVRLKNTSDKVIYTSINSLEFELLDSRNEVQHVLSDDRNRSKDMGPLQPGANLPFTVKFTLSSTAIQAGKTYTLRSSAADATKDTQFVFQSADPTKPR